jgi:hypothetical protein
MNDFIVEIEQALSPEFCQHLIEKFNNNPNKHTGTTGGGVDKSKKDSTDLSLTGRADWKEENYNISLAVLKGAIAYAKQYPFIITGAISPSMQDPKTGELRKINPDDIKTMTDEQVQHVVASIYTTDDLNMQHYQKGKGGYHHWHSEHFPHPTDPQQKSLHRTLLWLIYLNDVEEGGETEFFYQQRKIKPKQGSLILAPCGFTHTHRGSIPQSGDKYVLASWLMYNNAQKLYGR